MSEASEDSQIGPWGAHEDALSIRSLRAALGEGRCPHALLISGPEGIGKRDVSLAVARSLVCEGGEPKPCTVCSQCRRVSEKYHLDVEIVEPGGLCDISDHNHPRSVNIRICQIRRIERITSLKPFESPVRVIILDPADRITADASDAFLKTLEEPPDDVYFILLSSREQQLSETIRSRCRTVTLSPLPHPAIRQWVLGSEDARRFEEDERLEIANLSNGRIGWLQEALQGSNPIEVRGAQIEQLRDLSAAPVAERFAFAEQLGGGRGPAGADAQRDIDFLLASWADWFRDLLLASHGLLDRAMHRTRLDDLRSDSARYSEPDICSVLHQLQETRRLLRQGANTRLALDVLLLNLPRPSKPSPA